MIWSFLTVSLEVVLPRSTSIGTVRIPDLFRTTYTSQVLRLRVYCKNAVCQEGIVAESISFKKADLHPQYADRVIPCIFIDGAHLVTGIDYKASSDVHVIFCKHIKASGRFPG